MLDSGKGPHLVRFILNFVLKGVNQNLESAHPSVLAHSIVMQTPPRTKKPPSLIPCPPSAQSAAPTHTTINNQPKAWRSAADADRRARAKQQALQARQQQRQVRQPAQRHPIPLRPGQSKGSRGKMMNAAAAADRQAREAQVSGPWRATQTQPPQHASRKGLPGSRACGHAGMRAGGGQAGR